MKAHSAKNCLLWWDWNSQFTAFWVLSWDWSCLFLILEVRPQPVWLSWTYPAKPKRSGRLSPSLFYPKSQTWPKAASTFQLAAFGVVWKTQIGGDVLASKFGVLCWPTQVLKKVDPWVLEVLEAQQPIASILVFSVVSTQSLTEVTRSYCLSLKASSANFVWHRPAKPQLNYLSCRAFP